MLDYSPEIAAHEKRITVALCAYDQLLRVTGTTKPANDWPAPAGQHSLPDTLRFLARHWSPTIENVVTQLRLTNVKESNRPIVSDDYCGQDVIPTIVDALNQFNVTINYDGELSADDSQIIINYVVDKHLSTAVIAA